MPPKQKKRVSFSSGVDMPDDLLHAPAVYRHPDPLLRRLRVEDAAGVPINDIKTYFAGKKLLVLYFGGAFGEASLRDFHRDLAQLSMKENKEVAVIYVSTDVEEKLMKGVLTHKPWLRMTFHDGSDFAPIAKAAPAAVTELLRGEDFVTAAEVENMQYDMPTEGYEDPLEYEYVRPLSRAGLTAHIGALRTPTVTVYHLPTHRVVSRFATKENFRRGAIESKLALWKDGRSSGLTLHDIRAKMKWTLLLALFAIFYHLAVAYLGPEYNVLPQFVDRIFSGQFFSQPLPGAKVVAENAATAAADPKAAFAASIASAARVASDAATRSIAKAAKTLPTVSASRAAA